jgi:tRNA (guanine37-N1)-methyltransferase
MQPTDAASKQATLNETPAMFRPPVNRAMRTLDRSFFRRNVPLSVAQVFKQSDISNVRKDLVRSHDLLVLPRISSIREVKGQDGKVWKAMLLREDLKVDGRFIGLGPALTLMVDGYIGPNISLQIRQHGRLLSTSS